MHIIIQMASKDHQLRDYIKAINHLGMTYSLVSYFDDEKEFTGFNLQDKNLYTVSGISFMNALNSDDDLSFFNIFGEPVQEHNFREKFRESFFYSHPNRFDQRFAIANNMPMLNSDAQFIDIKENKHTVFDRDVFIKPSNDLKSFIGGILPSGMSISEFVLNKSSYMPSWENDTAIIASPKSIHSEYRFFVVDSEVVTGSRYFVGGVVNPSTEIPEVVQKEAERLSKLYEPDNAFTMDLALMTDGTITIVEYNCINMSGHYLCNINTLLSCLRDRKDKNFN